MNEHQEGEMSLVKVHANEKRSGALEAGIECSRVIHTPRRGGWIHQKLSFCI